MRMPLMLAGEISYSRFGLTIELGSKDKHFGVLSSIEKIEKLTEEQEYIAKMVPLYIETV